MRVAVLTVVGLCCAAACVPGTEVIVQSPAHRLRGHSLFFLEVMTGSSEDERGLADALRATLTTTQDYRLTASLPSDGRRGTLCACHCPYRSGCSARRVCR